MRMSYQVCCALCVLPQMTGGSNVVVFGRCDPATWHPDLDWLEGAMAGPSPPRMVVLINPCNPTGACCRNVLKFGNFVMLSQRDTTQAHSMHKARRLICRLKCLPFRHWPCAARVAAQIWLSTTMARPG